ncbi:MAG: hypothetical protein AUK48_04440 [Oscillatoriales cyanobacterium CG2_30_44_21]|nr:MAG: hypothetical protein AUK48_04440 [Oscillatoriales cyanobacterium CG2_30_44_21]
MAIVLSSKENFEFWISLIKLAIALNAIAMIGIFIFWLRLHKLDKKVEKYLGKYIHRHRRVVQPRLRQPPIAKAKIKTQVKVSTNLASDRQRSPQTHTKVVNSKLKKTSRWRWLLASLVASVTGTAIAFVQWSSSFIAPEYTALIWFGIGLFLVVSATYAL